MTGTETATGGSEMRHDVRYWPGGGEETARLDATDAPVAARTVSAEHAEEDGFFELLAMSRVAAGDPAAATGAQRRGRGVV